MRQYSDEFRPSIKIIKQDITQIFEKEPDRIKVVKIQNPEKKESYLMKNALMSPKFDFSLELKRTREQNVMFKSTTALKVNPKLENPKNFQTSTEMVPN